MNHSFVVCDVKSGYADRLAGFVNKKHLCPYLMESFTDVDVLEEYGKKHRIEVLLIDELLYTDRIEKLNIGKVFLLTEQHPESLADEENRLYKYTPIPEIMDAIMCDFADRNKNAMSGLATLGPKIIGAFTPATNLGHTSYLLTLALKTAEKRRAFYLNIRSTYGFRKMLDKVSDSDLSDVMYCIKTGNRVPADWPEGLVLNYGKLDYILPATPVSDLQCVGAEDWRTLFDILVKQDYEYIFLDLDESTEACIELLYDCDLIYAAYKDDYICKSAFSEFEEVMEKMGLSLISNKLLKISPPEDCIPENSEDFFAALKNSKMGEYVNEVLHESR